MRAQPGTKQAVLFAAVENFELCSRLQNGGGDALTPVARFPCELMLSLLPAVCATPSPNAFHYAAHSTGQLKSDFDSGTNGFWEVIVEYSRFLRMNSAAISIKYNAC